MLDAFSQIKSNYRLDLIGGYGNDTDDILNRAKNDDRMNCYGPCDSSELCKRLNEYDVIVVPSNMDGWNLHCNLAVNSGIGAITTNQAVSHELIEACGNGIIVKSGNVKSLKNAIEQVIGNPEIIDEWKAKTLNYSSRISYKTVAKYLHQVLEYSFLSDKGDRPKCPWIKTAEK